MTFELPWEQDYTASIIILLLAKKTDLRQWAQFETNTTLNEIK